MLRSVLFATTAILIALGATDARASAQFFGFGDLPGGGVGSVAYGVSADGSVVVGTGVSASGQSAFRWTQEGGMRSLKEVLIREYGLDSSVLTGWSLHIAFGISADGRTIVGLGINPDGNGEPWLARLGEPDPHPIPVPGALPLFASALGVFGFARWRQQRKAA